jgi:cytochrome c-550 PedF
MSRLAPSTHSPAPARRSRSRALARGTAALAAVGACIVVFAHGNVTPQAVDTTGLQPLGEEWRAENPYSGNKLAIEIGSSGFSQNCARCHGIEAISGGIAPDLRRLDNECATMADKAAQDACIKDNDEYFLTTVRHGRSRNGAVYMPPFEGVLSQEAFWAIKAYLETRREKPVGGHS